MKIKKALRQAKFSHLFRRLKRMVKKETQELEDEAEKILLQAEIREEELVVEAVGKWKHINPQKRTLGLRIAFLVIVNTYLSLWLLGFLIWPVPFQAASFSVEFPLKEKKMSNPDWKKISQPGSIMSVLGEEDIKQEKAQEREKKVNFSNLIIPKEEALCEEYIEEEKCASGCSKYPSLEPELPVKKIIKSGGVPQKKVETVKAKIPYAFKMEGGRRVCNKKNDKPHKSDQNKKRHMDMECCLDPDEIPNPHCYYSPSKYGKFLGK